MLAMTDKPFDADLAAKAILKALTSSDYAEGRAAFAEKRRPRFQGV
jgi:1,4-dihydroxy-2-naphthoyl-CoA synthase